MSDRYTVASARRALASLAVCMGMTDDLVLDVVSHQDTGSKVRAIQKSTHNTILGAEYLTPREAARAYNAAEYAVRISVVRATGKDPRYHTVIGV